MHQLIGVTFVISDTLKVALSTVPSAQLPARCPLRSGMGVKHGQPDVSVPEISHAFINSRLSNSVNAMCVALTYWCFSKSVGNFALFISRNCEYQRCPLKGVV